VRVIDRPRSPVAPCVGGLAAVSSKARAIPALHPYRASGWRLLRLRSHDALLLGASPGRAPTVESQFPTNKEAEAHENDGADEEAFRWILALLDHPNAVSAEYERQENQHPHEADLLDHVA
jgi:hypothetical protein